MEYEAPMQVAEFLRLCLTTFIWTDVIPPVGTAVVVILLRYASKIVP